MRTNDPWIHGSLLDHHPRTPPLPSVVDPKLIRITYPINLPPIPHCLPCKHKATEEHIHLS